MRVTGAAPISARLSIAVGCPPRTRFFTRSSLCAAVRPAHDPAIGTRPTELVMEWWVLVSSFALGVTTYGLYYIVDRLRSAP
jgi:hypothetical protein